MAELLFFHDDTEPPPQRFWRRWARAEIAAVRAGRVDGESTKTGSNRGPEAKSDPLRYDPVLLTDAERAEGISLNAALFRLLGRNDG